MHQKLRSTSYTPQEVRLIILGNAPQTDAALTTAVMSSPQTCEADATRQPAESASRALFSGHSTTIESMALPTIPPAPTSTQDARQLLEDYIKSSVWYRADMMEPSVGDAGVPTSALLLARSGESVYRCFVDTGQDQEGNTKHSCSACGFESSQLDRLIEHQRSKRGHKPVALRDERSWEALSQEVWYLKQEEEPLNHLGQSILIQWLKHSEERNSWSCCVPLEDGKLCGYRISRSDRAVIHVRGHLALKPYPCDGNCGNEHWYGERSLPHE